MVIGKVKDIPNPSTGRKGVMGLDRDLDVKFVARIGHFTERFGHPICSLHRRWVRARIDLQKHERLVRARFLQALQIRSRGALLAVDQIVTSEKICNHFRGHRCLIQRCGFRLRYLFSALLALQGL